LAASDLRHGDAVLPVVKDRIAYIDGLRAVAVLSVLFFHAGVHDPLVQHAKNAVSFVLQQGSHGVELFFVLSGFCLAYPSLSKLYAPRTADFNVPGYAARRLIRIVPPYYAAIVLFLGLAFTLTRLHAPLPEGMDPQAFTLPLILKQMLFLDGDARFIDASFWTLAIEFRWYFLFPILLWVWTRSPIGFALIGTAAIALQGTRMNNVDLLFLPIFMLGIVAADIYVREHRWARYAYVALPFTLFAAFASTAGSGWYFVENGPFWGIAMFLFVVAAGCTPLLRAVLSWRPLTAIGFTSYGIYLVHEPIIGLVQRSAAPITHGVWTFVTVSAAALAAGIIFSYCAERPFVVSRLRETLVFDAQQTFSRLFEVCRFGTRLPLAVRHVDTPQKAEAAAAASSIEAPIVVEKAPA
jgi:peptidoglycan/LPS O-acetylase OafA/YrhL